MADTVKENAEPRKLFLKKETLEMFMSSTARNVMNVKERLAQKRHKFVQSVPFLKKQSEKWHAFDARMEAKHGQVYTKIRDSAKNITRTVLAAQFGLKGIVCMCAYKTCEKAMSLLEPAQKAKENGETDSVLDYLKQNKEESRFTTVSGAISICTAACDVIGAPLIKGGFRIGKASWLIRPEIKRLKETTDKWLRGEESFVEVKRDAAVMGITFGTYFVSKVPMTRGSGKPNVPEENKIPEPQKEASPAEEKIRRVLMRGRECVDQVRGKMKNPEKPEMTTIFNIKRKKEGR